MYSKLATVLGLAAVLSVALTAHGAAAQLCTTTSSGVSTPNPSGSVGGYFVSSTTFNGGMGVDAGGRPLAVYPMFTTYSELIAAVNAGDNFTFVIPLVQNFEFGTADSALIRSYLIDLDLDSSTNNLQIAMSCSADEPQAGLEMELVGASLYPFSVDPEACNPGAAATCLGSIDIAPPFGCVTAADAMRDCIIQSTGCLGFLVSFVLPGISGGCAAMNQLALVCELPGGAMDQDAKLAEAEYLCGYAASITPTGDATAAQIVSAPTGYPYSGKKKSSAAAAGGAAAVAAAAAVLLLAL